MKKNRNLIVLIVSAIYFLIIISTLFYEFTGTLSKVVGKELPSWYSYYIYITSIIYFVGFILIIKMRKSALIGLTILTILLYLLTYFVGVFSIYSLITDLIIFSILWTQHKKMT